MDSLWFNILIVLIVYFVLILLLLSYTGYDAFNIVGFCVVVIMAWVNWKFNKS